MHRDRVGVAEVVHRVRARHADHDAVATCDGSTRPIAGELARRERDQVVGRPSSHSSSPEKQKYSTPEAGATRPRHVGAPAPEVLQPTGPDAGVVEIDPVVGERLRIGRSSDRRGQIAVPKTPAPPRPPSAGGAGSSASASSLSGMLESTPVTRLLGVAVGGSDDDVGDDALVVANRDAPVPELDGDARRLDPPCERLPHLTRAEPRVVELLDQARHVAPSQAQRRTPAPSRTRGSGSAAPPTPTGSRCRGSPTPSRCTSRKNVS